jgi:hypothetical protein
VKAGIVEPVTRQRFDKHFPAATNTQATIERLLRNDVFCCVSPETNIKRTPGRLLMTEKELSVGRRQLSSARAAVTRGLEHGKLQNLHC